MPGAAGDDVSFDAEWAAAVSGWYDDGQPLLVTHVPEPDFGEPMLLVRRSERVLRAERRSEVARVRQVWSATDLAAEQALAEGTIELVETGPAQAGGRADEIVVGLSPAFGQSIWTALNGMNVAEVLRQVLAGVEEEGLQARLVRVFRSIDLGYIGFYARYVVTRAGLAARKSLCIPPMGKQAPVKCTSGLRGK